MPISTIFANVSCSDIKASAAWYEKLFGMPPTRQPMKNLLEWHFTDSAEVQLYQQEENAGHCTLTLGVMPLEPERDRLAKAGLDPGPIEAADDFFIVRLRDPDRNLVVLASAKKS
jgi:catechol 2,3-dioxygenase-like lactoylglutathione lyase family enzyme